MAKIQAFVDVLLQQMKDRNRLVVELACYLSLAVRIEPALIRRMRLTFLPQSEPGIEADLWFSPLVQSRSQRSIMLRADILPLLREELLAFETPDKQSKTPLDKAWELLQESHRNAPPTLQLEEKVTYLALSRKPGAKEDIEKLLQTVVAAMTQEARADSLARWTARSLPQLPALARETDSVAVLALGSSVRLGNRQVLDVPFPDPKVRDWLQQILPEDLERVQVGVRLLDHAVEFGDPALEGSHTLNVPKTNPVLLELSGDERLSTYVRWEPGRIQRITVESEPIIIRTLLGETYTLRASQKPTQSDVLTQLSIEASQTTDARENVDNITSLDGAPHPSLAIELVTDVIPIAYYNQLHIDDFPLITVIIDNTGPHCVNVRLLIETFIEDYSEKTSTTIVVPKGKQEKVILKPLLKITAIETLTEIRPVPLYTTIKLLTERETALLDSESLVVRLLGNNVILLAEKARNGTTLDLTGYLAAWVTPHHPDVETLLRKATSHHPKGSLIGYPEGSSTLADSARIVREQAYAIFVTLQQDLHLAYVDSPPFKPVPQSSRIMTSIRMSSAILKSGLANCLDSTLLFASLLELAGIDPLIALIQGSAFVGWRINKDIDQYEFLETTLISQSFATAQQQAQSRFELAQISGDFNRELFDPRGFARLIDVTACRKKGIYPLSDFDINRKGASTKEETLALEAIQLEKRFAENNYRGDSNVPALHLIRGSIPVVISCPHAVRYTRRGQLQSPELFTGAFTIQLASLTKASALIYARTSDEDPNYKTSDDYKRQLRELTVTNQARFVLDLHGLAQTLSIQIAIGTGRGNNLLGQTVLLDLLKDTLEVSGITNIVIDDPLFAASSFNTISSFISSELQIPALQLAIHKDYRNPLIKPNEYVKMLLTLSEAINEIANQLSIQQFQNRSIQQTEREQQLEERFQNVVEDLGSTNSATRIEAAIMLRTFLQAGYEQFYQKCFELTVTFLRIRQIKAENAEPLDPFTLALIEAFKESFPLARELLHRNNSQFNLQYLDASQVQLDDAPLAGSDLAEIWMPGISLQRVILRDANLSKANLSQANLRYVDLTGAKLTDANLKDAIVTQANFTNATLTRANLIGADLREAKLIKADMTNADLSEAILYDADLTKANLSGANLSGAILKGSNLSGTLIEQSGDLLNTDLRDVHGLTNEQLEACRMKGAIVEEFPCPPNPFINEGANQQPETWFIGRDMQLHMIWDRLRSGGNISIIGPSGSGKTSILHLIAAEVKEQLEPNFQAIWLQFQPSTKLIEAQLILARQLGGYQAKATDLTNLLMDKHLILLLDDFQTLDKGERGLEVRLWLRQLTQDRINTNIQLVATSTMPLDEVFRDDESPDYSPLHNVIRYTVELGPFTESEVRRLITKALEGTPLKLDDFIDLLRKPMLPREMLQVCRSRYDELCNQ